MHRFGKRASSRAQYDPEVKEFVLFWWWFSLILREGIPKSIDVYFSSVVPNIPGYIGIKLVPVQQRSAKQEFHLMQQIKRLFLYEYKVLKFQYYAL